MSSTSIQPQSLSDSNLGPRTDVPKMNDNIEIEDVISVFQSSALLRIAYGVETYDGSDRQYNKSELVEQFDIGRSSLERQLDRAVRLSLLIEVETEGYNLYRINTDSRVAHDVVRAMTTVDEYIDNNE